MAPTTLISRPVQKIVVGFFMVILAGTLLLNLPISTNSGTSIGILDSLFTATSCVCVTGMQVVDAGDTFNLFGRIIMMLLVQIGGLGFMTAATFIFVLLGKRIRLSERLLIKESMGQDVTQGMVHLVMTAMIITFSIEALGALLLSLRFVPIYGFGQGVFYGVFHSIMAFCNAGFDIFGGFQSFTMYQTDLLVNFTLMFLIFCGGLGFRVVYEIVKHHSWKKFAFHTRVVLGMNAAIIVGGFLYLFLAESNNPGTLWQGKSTGDRALTSLFQVFTSRTAGFTTIDQNALMGYSKMATVIIMFIGASPGSTGGGIKTTTFYSILVMLKTTLMGKSEFNANGRRIARDTVMRSIAITLVALMLVLLCTMLIMSIEQPRDTEMFSTENVLFEVTSAFGTVGLSTGMTPHLQSSSKLIEIILMFAGRVGLLTLTFALAQRQSRRAEAAATVRFPDAKLML